VHKLPEILLSEDGSIAIRVSQDPFCQAFIEAFGGAILSTSANLNGANFPKSFQEISEKIKATELWDLMNETNLFFSENKLFWALCML
jgi:tRNA A37 threonylcarbamoyladenosine synthetase subunit TsaC/SUA5/YrdC